MVRNRDFAKEAADLLLEYADRLCATTTSAVSPAKPGWESEETPIGQPPYLASKDNGDHSMAEKRKAKRRR
jgi:hypothetical protein